MQEGRRELEARGAEVQAMRADKAAAVEERTAEGRAKYGTAKAPFGCADIGSSRARINSLKASCATLGTLEGRELGVRVAGSVTYVNDARVLSRDPVLPLVTAGARVMVHAIDRVLAVPTTYRPTPNMSSVLRISTGASEALLMGT